MATKSSTKPGRKVSKSTKSSSAKEKSPRKAAPNAASAATAAPASFRKKEVARNGLRSFAFHRGDKGAEAVLGSIRPNVVRAGAAAGRPSAAAAKAGMKAMDAETVARHYLTNALASEELPTFTAGGPEAEKSDFKLIAVEAVPLTGTQMVKFCQYYRRTPVYGSLVAVELDKKNQLVSINSALTEPTNVDPVASVAPADVLKTVARSSGQDLQNIKATPNVYYYFDRDAQRWRLVYITRDVPKQRDPEDSEENTAGVSNRRTQSSRLPQAFDYVVDAHSGELVAELPRSHNTSVKVLDGLKKMRTIRFSQNTIGNVLHDPDHNLHTFDFRFGNVDVLIDKLPGDYVANPPDPWDGAAVSAHANAADVLRFLSTVLKRNGLDNMGGSVRSSINCVERNGTKEWDNATWYMDQMMYGQSKVSGKLRSWALAKDIVAHELTHGITDFTARIEYKGESGALNESYSDIMGLIVANFGESDGKKWNWLIGEGLQEGERALRDMRRPGNFQQPSHMDDYEKIPNNDDFGGVHTNSGIHNKVAHNMLTAKDAQEKYLLKPRDVAALFYLALTQSLSRTSRFGDSRRGVELAARSLFANKTNKQARLTAVARAFDKVGIV
ncbi:MAG: M4 family metallopeptidase [Pyrinomonadaceae bacterium]